MTKLSKKQRFFDRGLPDDYDPHYFYEYRIAKRSKEAAGVEGFVYRLIPVNLIRSFAFAIDPLSQFKTSPGRISPTIRNITGTTISVLDTTRSQHVSEVAVEWAASKNFQGSPGSYGPVSYRVVSVYRSDSPKAIQLPLPRYLKDTSYATRPIGYTMGEFSKTIPSIYSGPRTLHWVVEYTQTYDIGVGQKYPDYRKSSKAYDYTIGPSAATYRVSDYNTLRNNEMNSLDALMQKHCLSMYKSINPSFRNYTLFRNVAELRDLPRSILTLKDTLQRFSLLEKLLDPKILKELRLGNKPESYLKTLSGEYLSYSFGWAQLYRDVRDLVLKPEKISRQVDFILRNSGQSLTFRTKRSFNTGGSGPGFIYDPIGGTVKQNDTSIHRSIELRMAVNMFIQFPTTNVPTFRADLFDRKLGVYPTFTDIYNLVPWTWLVDWFTGLGNYLEIIEEINKDRNLINWGFITGVSTVDLTTTHVVETYHRRNFTHNNVTISATEQKLLNRHSSTLRLNLQLRRNIASMFDVNATSEPSSLTTYQASILGALLSQRTKFTR